MTRPHQIRKIQSPPRAKGFIPLGFYRDRSDPVVLNIEEFESIRLLDYEGLTQEAAAKCMQVSRPTLTRIYERARGKVASALTEARQILIEGGNVVFKGNWYECDQCGSHFNNPLEELIASCPLCSSNRIQHLTDQKEEQKRERKDNRAGAMKMAIPLNGEKSTDKIAPYFARCSHFALVDPETCRAEIISNPYQDLSRGAGIRILDYLFEKYDVRCIVAFELGHNIQQRALEKGVQLIIIQGYQRIREQLLDLIFAPDKAKEM